jgi:hypothetical protein
VVITVRCFTASYLMTLSTSRLNSVDVKVINEHGAVGAVSIGKGNKFSEKTRPVPFCSL